MKSVRLFSLLFVFLIVITGDCNHVKHESLTSQLQPSREKEVVVVVEDEDVEVEEVKDY